MSIHYKFTIGPHASISMGIDVGWSNTVKSCALALRGVEWVDVPYNVAVYDNATSVGLFTIHELADFLQYFVRAIGEDIRLTVAIDGLLGQQAPPVSNRAIDAHCRRGPFWGRAFPNDVTGCNGNVYVNATYRLVDAICCARGHVGRVPPWWGDANENAANLYYCETNPTVGMALMLPPVDPVMLPSRKRALDIGNHPCRAKSDAYWRYGARNVVSYLLNCEVVADEQHHERVAGLYCLSVAVGLSNTLDGANGIVAFGADDGIYCVPPTIHRDWHHALERDDVGIRAGTPVHDDEIGILNLPHEAGNVRAVVTSDDQDYGETCHDDLLLRLDDNGGVWEQRNDWLTGLAGAVTVQTVDNLFTEVTLARVNGNKGQWRANPPTLTLARARGYAEQHLSLEHPFAIRIQVVNTG